MKAKFLIPSVEWHAKTVLIEEGYLDEEVNNECLSDLDIDLFNKIEKYLTVGKVNKTLQKEISEELFVLFAGENWSEVENDPDIKIKKEISKQIATIFSEIMPTSTPEKTKEIKEDSKKFLGSNLATRVLDVVKDDAQTIAIRLGAKQLAKAVQEPMSALLIQALDLDHGSATKNKIVTFLQSELGLGLISMACSVGLPMLPMPDGAKESLAELVKEMRIQSEMVITEPVVELFTAPVREFMSKQVLALPGLPGFAMPQLMSSNVEPKIITVKEIKTETKSKIPAKKNSKKKSDSKITVKEIKNKEARA